MTTYRDLLNDATKTLYEQCDTPRIDAEYLMQHAIGQSMTWLISYGDTIADSEHIKRFTQLIEQRARGIPVAYLIGEREFWTLKLDVNEHVLIPRGDTEILVEQALERLQPNAPLTVVDLGTGSGAIALSIAKERPTSRVIAVDKHENALNVAKTNACKNGVTNVEFLHSDWFEKLNGPSFDLIASNPPYVEHGDPHLQQGDLRFEPMTALAADGEGFSDLDAIIDQAPDYLNKGGWLLLEHGATQSERVANSLTRRGFASIELYADLNHLPRCTAAQWN